MLIMEPLLCFLGCMFWVVVLEDPSTTHFLWSGGGKKVVIQDFAIHGHVHLPVNAGKLPWALRRKTPPKHNTSTTMLDGEDGGHILYFSSSKHVELSCGQRAQSWSHLTTAPSPSLSESLICSLANLRRPWIWAFLSRGTLHALQDSKLLHLSVLPAPPMWFLADFLTFVMINETPRGDILHGALGLVRLTIMQLWRTSSNNCTNSCHLYPVFYLWLCYPFQPCVSQKCCPWYFGQLFSLAHGGDVGHQFTLILTK